MRFQKGDKVQTLYGTGTVLKQEGFDGVLSERYCIVLDNPPTETFKNMQIAHGGLYFFNTEITLIKE